MKAPAAPAPLVPTPVLVSHSAVADMWDNLWEKREKAESNAVPLEFKPNEGPQTEAYNHVADQIGYGGAAGGGKTFLALGLAITKHKNSIVFRREATQLRQIIEDSRTLIGDRGDFNENKGIWRNLPGNRRLQMAGVADEEDKNKWKGQAHDLKIFDEATEFSESQVRFLTAWTRSPDKNQKCTVLLCFNPPTTVDGEWIIKYFAPWLDEDYDGVKAQPGEIRYFAMVGEDEREMPDARPFVVHGETVVYDFDPRDYRREEILSPKSRTFIRAKVGDNPYYGADYLSTLQNLPKEVRDAMLHGKFARRGDDNPWQLIPSQYMDAAQKRWRKELPDNARLVSNGLDVARGGKDNTVWTSVYAGTRQIDGKTVEVLHFTEQVTWPGVVTHDGEACAGLVLPLYREGSVINVDSIGYGASAFDELKKINVEGQPPVVFGVNNGQPNPKDPSKRDRKGQPISATDRSGKFTFVNVRAQMGWRLRELMDEQSSVLVEMPPSKELRSDLCTPAYRLQGGKYYVESKDDVKKRLPERRSTDFGDSAILCVANLGPGKAKAPPRVFGRRR